MINWDTVTTSAITALIVALSVEYFAKPRLEARKERILELLRGRRELKAALISMSVATSILTIELSLDMKPAAYQALRDEQTRQYQRLWEQIQQMVDNIGRYAGPYVWKARDLVIQYVLCLYTVMMSTRTRAEKAATIQSLIKPMAAVMDAAPPWFFWRMPAQIRAWGEVNRLIAAAMQDIPPASER
ncbi:hypothetical protein Psi02_15390 [Planotetraspora silvatica]|uniref:Uncharacterized protein n=1 Tax=Planotetraspora silvatica TaxID=234614 RepID=A0A8J3UIG6_9ACTN|nr:hypothetical protein [Planotetraspora silvatica]GII45115.1 hypothetical protein Psi02_15390 [Planotetraspora silvatica]